MAGHEICRLLEFQNIPLVGVDHPGGPIGALPGDAAPIVEVGMAVEKQGGVVFVQQAVERGKAHMGQIMTVHHVLSRSMGQKNVKPFFAKQAGLELPYPPGVHRAKERSVY